jgi:hypothetical protein
MKRKATGLAIPLVLFAAALHAQSPSADGGWRMPPEAERCPSKWGAGDQRGTANMMTRESVVRAARLIKTGESFELGALLSPDPKEAFINAGRVFNLYTKPSPPLQNARQVNEELVVTELGQIGTQLDAFAHQMWGDSFYNCYKLGDIGTRTGFRKLGVEHVGGLMARGVLIDVAGLKGVDMLPTSYTVTPEDLRQALAKDRRRQLLRRGAALGEAAQPADPRHDADPARRLPDGEPGARGARGGARLRVRLHRAAAEAEGRDRLGGRPDGDALTPKIGTVPVFAGYGMPAMFTRIL